jgi:hypothetical protein
MLLLPPPHGQSSEHRDGLRGLASVVAVAAAVSSASPGCSASEETSLLFSTSPWPSCSAWSLSELCIITYLAYLPNAGNSRTGPQWVPTGTWSRQVGNTATQSHKSAVKQTTSELPAHLKSHVWFHASWKLVESVVNTGTPPFFLHASGHNHSRWTFAATAVSRVWPLAAPMHSNEHVNRRATRKPGLLMSSSQWTYTLQQGTRKRVGVYYDSMGYRVIVSSRLTVMPCEQMGFGGLWCAVWWSYRTAYRSSRARRW